MIRMNEYAQPLANVPSVLPMREPLKEVVAPSRLLYEGIPEATLYEPPSQAIPEASGYAINPMKPIANLPPSTPERPAGGARGRPRLSEEERAKREQFAQMVKKQKEEEKFIAKQKKAEEKERAKKSKKEGKTGGGVPANSDSGYEN